MPPRKVYSTNLTGKQNKIFNMNQPNWIFKKNSNGQADTAQSAAVKKLESGKLRKSELFSSLHTWNFLLYKLATCALRAYDFQIS